MTGRETLTTPDLLGFAGIAPVTVPALPLATQLAEKLHAYTRTYEDGRPSSRTKDLIDLALVAALFPLDAHELRIAIDAVFARRATHQPPDALPAPPPSWRTAYRRIASDVGLSDDLDAGHTAAAAMLDPVLRHHVTTGTWDPGGQLWHRSVPTVRRLGQAG